MHLVKKYYLPLVVLSLIIINAIVALCPLRIDLTSDKRYTISTPTQNLMQQLSEPIHVEVYLTGQLNPGFLRLERATRELLNDLNDYSKQGLHYTFTDPTEVESTTERDALYEKLAKQGMQPTMIYERSQGGQSVQKLVFPFAKLSYNGKSRIVSLLKNLEGRSGEENLNISIENLEYNFTDALRTTTRTEVAKVAFIEGHGELDERMTHDLSRALSQYFQVDRGVLGTDAHVLDAYKAIIIAGPKNKFSENDKYIIDQYIMQGGRVMWLIDGVRLDHQALSQNGTSPIIPLDANLTDQLFRYGVRINPVVLQDEQCMLLPVNVAPEGAAPDFQPMPWYYAPLLNTSPYHAATRNVSAVSSSFVSAIEFVGDNPNLKRNVLLATSGSTHALAAPNSIDVGSIEIGANHFHLASQPIAVALEGVFESVYAHRNKPTAIHQTTPQRKTSAPTRQIFIASSSLISNEMEHGQALPLGYDRYTGKHFGNRDFALNALLYLSDEEGWIDLRNKQYALRLLDQNKVRTSRTMVQWLNLGLPLALLLLFGALFNWHRKRKYSK